MEAVKRILNADVLTPIIDLPWKSNNMQVEVVIMPLHKMAVNIETRKKITDLKGLGRDVWKNINIEDHIKNEREAWN